MRRTPAKKGKKAQTAVVCGGLGNALGTGKAVSYTHLDVYKRQLFPLFLVRRVCGLIFLQSILPDGCDHFLVQL